MQLDDLGNLVAHREHGVEGRHGVLENHRDFLAAHLAHFLGTHFEQILVLEEDFARDHLAGRRGDEAHHAEGGGGLAGAGLAHEADGLSALEAQIDAVDRLEDGFIRKIVKG